MNEPLGPTYQILVSVNNVTVNIFMYRTRHDAKTAYEAMNGILHDMMGAGVGDIKGYAIRTDDLLTKRTVDLIVCGEESIDSLEDIIKSITDDTEPSDPPAVGDSPNDYAWSEHN